MINCILILQRWSEAIQWKVNQLWWMFQWKELEVGVLWPHDDAWVFQSHFNNRRYWPWKLLQLQLKVQLIKKNTNKKKRISIFKRFHPANTIKITISSSKFQGQLNAVRTIIWATPSLYDVNITSLLHFSNEIRHKNIHQVLYKILAQKLISRKKDTMNKCINK